MLGRLEIQAIIMPMVEIAVKFPGRSVRHHVRQAFEQVDNRIMLSKPKLPFLIHDVERLNRQFYAGYDERFLARKVAVLSALLDNPELLKEFLGDGGPDEEKHMRHAMAAEILFTEFHQFESFFAMLLAPFQGLPHWIFLNTYSTAEIKKKVRLFIDGDFNTLSDCQSSDHRTFISRAVYLGCGSETTEAGVWQATLDNLWWLINRMAVKYSRATEYNAYKHGLRIMSGTSSIGFSSPKTPSKAFWITAEHSITHLRFDEQEDGTAVLIETKAFNPEESMAHVRIMADILTNVKRIRLAAFSSKDSATGVRTEFTLFPEIDKEGLQRLTAPESWALPA